MDAHQHDALDDLIGQELQSALSVDPSPEFAARVRRRIAEEQTRTARHTWTFAASMLAASAVLVIVASVLWRPNPVSDPHVQPVVTDAGPVITSPRDRAPAALAGAEPVLNRPIRVATRRHEPDVVMPADERRGLERFMEFVGRQDETSVGLMASMAGMASEAGLAIPQASVPDTGQAAAAPANSGSQNDGALVIAPITFRPLNDDSY